MMFLSPEESKHRQEWLASLKVGDHVAFEYKTWGCYGSAYSIGTIVKITPTRKIDVRFSANSALRRFREDGRLQGGGWGDNLLPVTPEIIEVNLRSKLLNRIRCLKDGDWVKLPTEALKAVYEIVQKHLPQKEE